VRSFVIALLAAAQFVAAQSPVLHRASPLGIPAGQTTEVKLLGEGLDEITDVWCSVAEVRIETTDGPRLLITTPKDAVGLVAFRVATTNGASDLAMFMIDDLPSTLEAGTNRTVATAQRAGFAAAVDATTDELAFDFYSFDAKKGDPVSIDVVASRIGSKLDPVLRVLDAQRREVAFCEDASGAARDCRIQFRPPASGEYLLEVRDIAYGGGPAYFYRLRLGKFGFATCTFPVVARPGVDVAVLGPADERLKSVPARGRYADFGAGFVAVRTAELDQSFEHEPNEGLQKALSVEIPSALNGRFEKPEDGDWFRFKAGQDERLVFLTKTRSAGSPCDVFLEVRDAEGKLIAESNPVGAQDTALTNKFASAGDYFLVARELAGRGAPDFAYQIEVRKFEPTFTLAVDEVKFEAKNGAEFSVPVSCARYDFSEKIALEFPGLPDGFTFENATIEEKKTNATVKIKVPSDATPGTLLAFAVVGSAKQKQVAATTMAALRRDRPLLLHPPPELDGVLVLGVTGADPAPRPRRRRT
jgi:hypothetical protein